MNVTQAAGHEERWRERNMRKKWIGKEKRKKGPRKKTNGLLKIALSLKNCYYNV